MADKKVSEKNFIDENTIIEEPVPQVIVTAGADIPQNGAQKRMVDQTYWSLAKHQFKNNLLADFLANSKPIYCKYQGESFFPIFKEYAVDLGLAKWEHQFLNVDWKTLEFETAIWPPVRFDQSNVDLFNTSAAPSVETGHYLGTDGIGRDVLAGLIHGSRISLAVGFVAAGIAITIGVLLGAFSGYYGGKVDLTIMRFVEIMQLFPAFFLIITIVALYGSSIWFIMAGLGVYRLAGTKKP